MRGTLKETAATSRHPETAVQRRYEGRGVHTVWKFQASATVGTVVVPLLPRRPCASVDPTAPDADMHGRRGQEASFHCSRRHDAGAGEPGATRHYARRRTVGRRQPERHHLPLGSDSNSAHVVRTITGTFEDRAARGSPVLAPGHWQARRRCPGLPAPLLLTTPGGLSCCFKWCLHQGDGAQPRSGLNHPVIGEMPILWPDALVEMTVPLPRLMVTWPEALVL